MSLPQPPQPAKLIVGLLLNDRSLLPELAEGLRADFGAIDMVSPWFPFNYTEYYAPEMGQPLHRRMLVFEELIEQQALARIKLATNRIENRYARDGKRQVNLDPGYLLYERFVLATGKNYTHRIYIGEKIYADLTLIYQQGQYHALPWTYPDYASPEMRMFLLKVRQKYGADLSRYTAGLRIE
jgi:hypothetical protein